MSLYANPETMVQMLRQGKMQKVRAEKEVNDLLAEISSGVYTFQDLGLKDERELRDLLDNSPEETFH
jgi:hypothetical protein